VGSFFSLTFRGNGGRARSCLALRTLSSRKRVGRQSPTICWITDNAAHATNRNNSETQCAMVGAGAQPRGPSPDPTAIPPCLAAHCMVVGANGTYGGSERLPGQTVFEYAVSCATPFVRPALQYVGPPRGHPPSPARPVAAGKIPVATTALRRCNF